jgi:hypothetical protein
MTRFPRFRFIVLPLLGRAWHRFLRWLDGPDTGDFTPSGKAW